MRTAELADRVRSFFETDHHGALAVYLFGSRAREAAGPESDVDLALLYPELPTSPTLDSLPLLLKGDLEEIPRRHRGRRCFECDITRPVSPCLSRWNRSPGP